LFDCWFSQFPDETEKIPIRLRLRGTMSLGLGAADGQHTQLPAEGRMVVSPFRPRPPRLSSSQWRAGGNDEKHLHNPLNPV